MVLKKQAFHGVSIDIHVNAEGLFTAIVAGERLTAPVLKDLETVVNRKLRATKRVRIAFPASLVGWVQRERYSQSTIWVCGTGVRQITITNINARTGALLAKCDATGERLSFESSGHRHEIVRRMSSDQVDEYIRLKHEHDAAEERFCEYMNPFKFEIRGLEQLVREQLSAAADDPHEAPVEESEDPR